LPTAQALADFAVAEQYSPITRPSALVARPRYRVLWTKDAGRNAKTVGHRMRIALPKRRRHSHPPWAYLDEGESAVGTHVDVVHQAPTPEGRRVTASAEVTKIDGQRIDFRIEATDGLR
jgi:Fluoroacetyl-CoA-specific thioesterase